MRTFSEVSWPEIQELRAKVAELQTSRTLLEAAEGLCRLFTERFDTVVLARVFAVCPLASLPERDRKFAEQNAHGEPLTDKTPVLCLLGTAGRQPAWNDRTCSQGHLAIPLSSSASVRGAPMIAQLLNDLQVSLRVFDEGGPIASRELMAGRSRTFYVPDALRATDAEGRLIIAATEFARASGISSVFGAGGSYVDGTVIVFILFCAETLEREVADRFASFIAAFKLATARLIQQRRLFDELPPG